MARAPTEPAHVHGAHLLDEHPRGLTAYLDLGAKRCRPRAAGGGGDDHERTGEELVRLDDDTEAVTVLFVADPLRVRLR
jgi:hypothetical protein